MILKISIWLPDKEVFTGCIHSHMESSKSRSVPSCPQRRLAALTQHPRPVWQPDPLLVSFWEWFDIHFYEPQPASLFTSKVLPWREMGCQLWQGLMDLLQEEGERRKQRGCRFENFRLYIQLKFGNPSSIVKSQTTRWELKTSIGLQGLIEEWFQLLTVL